MSDQIHLLYKPERGPKKQSTEFVSDSPALKKWETQLHVTGLNVDCARQLVFAFLGQVDLVGTMSLSGKLQKPKILSLNLY